MYILLQDNGNSYFLSNKSSYIIGRKNSDIVVLNDSISRNHTKITIRDKNVFVEDLNSSNKTFINGKALQPKIEEKLSVGSKIQLGNKGICFTLKRDLFVVTSSGLDTKQKQNLKNLIHKLGGLYVENWKKECTHLIVDTLTCTLKVMCALILNIDIVTVKYLDERAKAVENKNPLPNPVNFRPMLDLDISLGKSLKVDFDVDRTKLFNGKVFVFPTDNDLKRIKEAVILSGGQALSFSNYPVTEKELSKTKLEYCFVTTPESIKNTDSVFNSRIHFMTNKKRRPIPMQEIALAIISNKCDINCNSMFDKIEHIFSAKQVDVEQNILVPETQSMEITNTMNISASVKDIPGTFDTLEEDIVISEKDVKKDDKFSFKENKRTGETLAGNMAKIPKVDSLNIQRELPITHNISSSQPSQIKENIKPPSSQVSSKKELENKRKIAFENKPKYNLEPSNKRQKVENPFESLKSAMPAPLTKFKPFDIFDANLDKSKKSTTDNTSKKIKRVPSDSSNKETQLDEYKKDNPDVKKKATVLSSKSLLEDKTSISSNSSKSNISHKEEGIKSKSGIVPCTSTSSIHTGDIKGRTICVWLDKTTHFDDSISSKIKKEEDEATKAFIKCFKETVVIVDRSIIKYNSSREFVCDASTSIRSNKINYKRFKKTQPLKMQTRIIPMSNRERVVCGATGIAEYFVDDGDMDIGNFSILPDIVKPVKKNKFVFEL